jgi:hypothetical protein
MSLLTKASLVMTPNAIKESKVYSVIPANGNGDLTFTRGTNASGTLNNDNLLIENAPYNLMSNSNVFTSAYYSKSLVAVTSNTIASITGAVNASTLTEVAGTNSHHIHENVGSFTPVVGSSYTMSCYLKQPTSSANRYVQLPFFIAGFGSNAYVNFDLQTLTKGTIGASITSSDISLISNGWIRITATAVATATGASGFQLSLIPASTSTRTESYTVTAGSENSIYIYGFQVVFGTVAKDYFNTTDRLNVPRLNYDTVGGCPNLLLEPQRTNSLLNSVWSGSSTSPTSWSLNGTGVSTRIASIKNPNVGAYNFVSTAIARIFFFQTQTFTINTTSCLSVYVESASVPVQVQFILAIINAVGTPTYFKNNVSITATTNIEAGNTYSIVYAASATTTISEVRVGLHNTGIVGNVTLSMPQLQTGLSSIAAYSTSFIPTTTGAVTRNADTFTRSNIYTNRLITSAGGAWYLEINNNLSLTRDNSGTGLYIGDSATAPSNSFGVINTGTGRLVINKKIAGTLTSLYTTTTNTIKVVFNWNGSTMDVFVNGTKQVTATTFTFTALEFLSAYLCYVPKYIKGIYLFPAPLTDTECTNLTA